MNILITIAIVIMLSLPNVNAQNVKVHVPNEINMILDKDYPGWELSKLNEPWEISYWKKKKANPSFISGDFNGDGLRDYALTVVHSVPSPQPKERIIIAFLRNGKSYSKLILESGFVDPGLDITLHLIKKGSRGQEFDKEEEFSYKYDAIDVGYSDKGSQSYIWKDGKFGTITTSD